MTAAKTMADVLADHHSHSYNAELGTVFCLDLTCGWDAMAHNFAIAADVFAEHQAEMLNAAGFGLVVDAKAEALEEAAGHLDDMEDGKPAPDLHGPYAAWLRARAAAERGGQ